MLETRPAQTRDYEFASLSQHFHRDANVMGCTVDQGRFRVYSDWRTHGDGFGRMLVHGMPDDDTPNQRTAAGKALGGTSCPRRHTLAALSLSLSLGWAWRARPAHMAGLRAAWQPEAWLWHATARTRPPYSSEHAPSDLAGKALQRLLELDKYRALALLALPFSQKLTPRIEALSEELLMLTNAIGGGGGGGVGGGDGGGDGEGPAALGTQQVNQRELLDRLCSLEAEGLKHTSNPDPNP